MRIITSFLNSQSDKRITRSRVVVSVLFCGWLLAGCKETDNVFLEPAFRYLDAEVATIDSFPEITIDYRAFHVDVEDSVWQSGFDRPSLINPQTEMTLLSSAAVSLPPRVAFFVHLGGFTKSDLKRISEGMEVFFDSLESESPQPEVSCYLWGESTFYEVSRKTLLAAFERKSKKQINSETVDDLRLKIADQASSYYVNSLVILLGNMPVDIQLGGFRRQLNDLEQRVNLWWILLTTGTILLPEEFQSSHCLLIQDIQHDLPFESNLVQKYKLVSNSYGQAIFSVSNPLEFENSQVFTFSLTGLPLSKVPLELTMNPEIINEYVLASLQVRAWSLLEGGDYQNALSAYREYRESGADPSSLDSLARSLVLSRSRSLKTPTDIDEVELFLSETSSDFSSLAEDSTWWSKRLKEPLVNRLVTELCDTDTSPAELMEREQRILSLTSTGSSLGMDVELRILRCLQARFSSPEVPENFKRTVSERILQIDPLDKEANFMHFTLRAQTQIRNHQYLQAIRSLSRATYYKASSEHESSMRRLTTVGFEYYFGAGMYNSLVRMHEEHIHLDADNFANHYYVFIAADSLNDSPLAVEKLEWIAHNWRDSQNLITWSELNSQLQEHYLVAGDLEESLALTKRIIQEDDSRMSLMQHYFMVYRLVPLEVFMELLGAVAEIENAEEIYQALFARILIQKLPEYVEALAILDQNGNVISDFAYLREPFSTSYHENIAMNQLVSFTRAGQGTGEKLVYILPMGDQYCLVRVTPVLTNREMESARRIEQLPNEERRWHQLEKRLKKRNRDLFTYLVNYVFTAVGNLEASRLDTWMTTLSEFRDLEYLVVQRANGEVLFSENFNQDDLQYPGKSWSRSSGALALFRTYPTWGNRVYEDIAQPIYGETLWNGVTRFGFEMIEE